MDGITTTEAAIIGGSDDDLLTLSEAAAVSGLSAATLRSYINGRRGTEGKPPKPPVLTGVKRGPRLLMVHRRDLDAYLVSRTRRPDRAKLTPIGVNLAHES